ncbi:MAG: hypothetical protein JJU28_15470, partial [Cyclobacteriaceae bacterium]|nr:hypothetical protein [Cyclobacteriaceae bacterium]
QRTLLENLLIKHDRKIYLKPVLQKIDNLKKQTVNTINEAIGIGLLEQTRLHNDCDFLPSLASNQSDLVRCWVSYTIGKDETSDIAETLESIKPLAADPHFGVREVAWLSVRQKISRHITNSIAILSNWTSYDDDNLRRFASEATRPRGVWCEHIEMLKQNPEIGMPILEPLKSDNSKYVQDSVGNWLNDASKTQPVFVKELCKRWDMESDTKQTKYIIKKALRSIDK